MVNNCSAWLRRGPVAATSSPPWDRAGRRGEPQPRAPMDAHTGGSRSATGVVGSGSRFAHATPPTMSRPASSRGVSSRPSAASPRAARSTSSRGWPRHRHLLRRLQQQRDRRACLRKEAFASRAMRDAKACRMHPNRPVSAGFARANVEPRDHRAIAPSRTGNRRSAW